MVAKQSIGGHTKQIKTGTVADVGTGVSDFLLIRLSEDLSILLGFTGLVFLSSYPRCSLGIVKYSLGNLV